MNKYKFKKILENHSLYYADIYNQHLQLRIQRDYVRGWTDAIWDLANKTGIKLYSGILNDLLCRFSTIHNISEILSDCSQEVIIPHHINDKDAYLKGYYDVKIRTLINLAKYPDDFLYRDIVNIHKCENDDLNFAVSLMAVVTILMVKKCKTYFTIKGFTIGAIIGILFMYFMGH